MCFSYYLNLCFKLPCKNTCEAKQESRFDALFCWSVVSMEVTATVPCDDSLISLPQRKILGFVKYYIDPLQTFLCYTILLICL